MGERNLNDAKNKFDTVRIITNPLSSNKNLDADGMIESILSKKQVFVKKSPNSFPLWLTPDTGKVPPLYGEVWKAVQIPANPGFCNTAILSQILMTSGVTTQTLGYIWSLANKKCIGVLTEEELYLTMALIAISQNGTVIHDVDILKQVHEPIIPRLDLNIIKHFQNVHRYPPSHMLPTTTPLNTQRTPPTNATMSNMTHSNFSSHSIVNSMSNISYPSDSNKLENTTISGGHQTYISHRAPSNSYQCEGNIPKENIDINQTRAKSSKPYQSETGMVKDNIPIQNISSMVQLQTEAKARMSYDWNNSPDDDEFTEFQSSDKPSASNVSITLNPIHYLMTASPAPSSTSNRKLSSNSSNNCTAPKSSAFTNNSALNSNNNDSSTLINSTIFVPNNNSNINKNTEPSLSSLKNIENRTTPKVLSQSVVEDDDFTDFQSALDFDVQIKQPNLLENIKTIIETKQPEKQTRSLIRKTTDDHIASVLVDNVPQKTKLEVLDTMSDERNTTMYSTQRDYSALKDIEATSLFELKDGTTVDNAIYVHSIAKETNTNVSNIGNGFESTSLFDIDNELPPAHGSTNETNISFPSVGGNFKSSQNHSVCTVKLSSGLLLGNIDSLSLNTYDTLNKIIPSNIYPSDTGNTVSTINVPPNLQLSSTIDDYDDDFTDFKQAQPLDINDIGKDDSIIVHSKVSSNYDCLRGLNDENNLTTISSSIFSEKIQNQPESVQHTSLTSPSANTETCSSFTDDSLFGSTDTNQDDQHIVTGFDAVNENINEDDFSEFIHSTLNQMKIKNQGENENKFIAHDGNDSFTNFKQAPNVTQDDDEFTNFEQAPRTTHDINKEMTTFDLVTNITAKTNDMSSLTDRPSKRSCHFDTLDKNDALEKQHDASIAINEKHKGNYNDDKHRDKYSALRGLDFLDEDNSAKDSSDGDTGSLQEDKERDISDGDNISLQLPCVETQEQDTVQSKCYEACVYTLETSLNLFQSNHIESSIIEHPKVIHHLKCLAEVYQVGKRLQRSGHIVHSHAKLDSAWNALNVYFSETTSFETNINQNDQEVRPDSSSVRQERCEICLSESIHLVEENNAKYHPQCINFYLNCVESTPPPCMTSVH